MTDAERDAVIDEVLDAINAMSGDEWVNDVKVRWRSPTSCQRRAIYARVAAMKSCNHLIGA
jgi:hypothetical protein